MANDVLTVVAADGSTKTLTSRDTTGSSGPNAQRIDVGPWVPTLVAGAQYALTVSTAVVSLTQPAGATHALITVDGAAVRYKEDNGTPSASSGMLLPDGFIGELPLPNQLKFIRAAAVDASLNVSYRKYV